MSARSAPSQWLRVSRSWVCDRAISRDWKLSAKVRGSSCERAVCMAIDWTVARVFFTRWFSSSIISFWRWAARTVAVTSWPWTKMPAIWPSASRIGW
jgi:hypothetical protein